MITEYMIVQSEGGMCFARLTETVNQLIGKGWEPHGGVCFVDRQTYIGVAQAMVRVSPQRTNTGDGHEG